MHIPDSFLTTQTSIPLLGAAFVGIAHAFRVVRARFLESVPVLKARFAGAGIAEAEISTRLSDVGRQRMARMASVGSLIFALQMVNFSIDGGTSGHLIGGVLAALVAGPFEALLILSAVLGAQALFFADGGLLALGANIVNLGVIAALGGHGVYRLSRRYVGSTMSIAIAAWLSVMFAATATSIELAASGMQHIGQILPAMLRYHTFIGIGEAVLTVGIVLLLARYQYPMDMNEEQER